MADKMEMSLEDIIKSNKNSRGRRGRGRGRSRGSDRGSFRSSGRSPATGTVQRGRGRGGISRSSTRGGVNAAWKHALINGSHKLGAATITVQASIGPAKLVVSNLDFGITDLDIHELFAEFGSLKSATVYYDRSSRSLGTADVVFERRRDAIKAMKEYNGVPLDGRNMTIQLVTPNVPGRMTRNGRKFQDKNTKEGTASRGRGGWRSPRTSRRMQPTAEELDAELDAYTKEREA